MSNDDQLPISLCKILPAEGYVPLTDRMSGYGRNGPLVSASAVYCDVNKLIH